MLNTKKETTGRANCLNNSKIQGIKIPLILRYINKYSVKKFRADQVGIIPAHQCHPV